MDTNTAIRCLGMVVETGRDEASGVRRCAETIASRMAQVEEYTKIIVDDRVALLARTKSAEAEVATLLAEVERVKAERETISDLYHELLYSVETRAPGESRHQTALRYIREVENRDGGEARADLGGAGKEGA